MFNFKLIMFLNCNTLMFKKSCIRTDSERIKLLAFIIFLKIVYILTINSFLSYIKLNYFALIFEHKTY